MVGFLFNAELTKGGALPIALDYARHDIFNDNTGTSLTVNVDIEKFAGKAAELKASLMGSGTLDILKTSLEAFESELATLMGTKVNGVLTAPPQLIAAIQAQINQIKAEIAQQAPVQKQFGKMIAKFDKVRTETLPGREIANAGQFTPAAQQKIEQLLAYSGINIGTSIRAFDATSSTDPAKQTLLATYYSDRGRTLYTTEALTRDFQKNSDDVYGNTLEVFDHSPVQGAGISALLRDYNGQVLNVISASGQIFDPYKVASNGNSWFSVGNAISPIVLHYVWSDNPAQGQQLGEAIVNGQRTYMNPNTGATIAAFDANGLDLMSSAPQTQRDILLQDGLHPGYQSNEDGTVSFSWNVPENQRKNQGWFIETFLSIQGREELAQTWREADWVGKTLMVGAAASAITAAVLICFAAGSLVGIAGAGFWATVALGGAGLIAFGVAAKVGLTWLGNATGWNKNQNIWLNPSLWGESIMLTSGTAGAVGLAASATVSLLSGGFTALGTTMGFTGAAATFYGIATVAYIATFVGTISLPLGMADQKYFNGAISNGVSNFLSRVAAPIKKNLGWVVSDT